MPWTAESIPTQAGKIAVVTGANSGIGYHTALELARAGARVILACRDLAKADAALARIRHALPDAQLEARKLDLADLHSIRQFSETFDTQTDSLDLLINNAGVMAVPKRHRTTDGFELQFGTNHLGHFALSARLLPLLLRAPAPRIVTVSSIAHSHGTIDLDNLNGERRYKDLAAYNASKLANLLFALELHRRARDARLPLASIAAHPGVATTNLFAAGSHLDRQPLFSWLTEKFVPLLGHSDAKGALPILFAATSPDAESGRFYGPDGRFQFVGNPTLITPAPRALDRSVAANLWQRSEELTGIPFPLFTHEPLAAN